MVKFGSYACFVQVQNWLSFEKAPLWLKLQRSWSSEGLSASLGDFANMQSMALGLTYTSWNYPAMAISMESSIRSWITEVLNLLPKTYIQVMDPPRVRGPRVHLIPFGNKYYYFSCGIKPFYQEIHLFNYFRHFDINDMGVNK